MPDHKQCNICNIIKDLSMFEFDKRKNVHRNQCKNCRNQKNIERRKRKKAEESKVCVLVKLCAYCKIEKDASQFHKNRNCVDGLSTLCKSCRSITIKAQKQRKLQEVPSGQYKICSRCNESLCTSKFTINNRTCDKLSTFCKECAKPNLWNDEKQRASYKKYDAKKRNRIRRNMCSRIRHALRSQNVTKQKSTIDFISCDIPFLRKWLEYQFQDNMKWTNMGVWHIDHVRPCSSFDLENESQQKECFHWKNLRPLWGKDNLEKSNKIDDDLICTHKQLADNFEKLFSAQVKEGELRELLKISSTN